MTTITIIRRALMLIILGIMAILLLSQIARAEDTLTDAILTRVARTQDVPANLLRAICTVESGMNLQAFTQDDGGPGNHAFGACQILLTTAEHLGFRDQGHQCRDYTTKQRVEYSVCKLFGPVTNFHFAAKYLKWQLKRYRNNPDAIAAYNSGTVRMCPTDGRSRNRAGKVLGTCRKGEYVNQEYVTKVLNMLRKLEEGK